MNLFHAIYVANCDVLDFLQPFLPIAEAEDCLFFADEAMAVAAGEFLLEQQIPFETFHCLEVTNVTRLGEDYFLPPRFLRIEELIAVTLEGDTTNKQMVAFQYEEQLIAEYGDYFLLEANMEEWAVRVANAYDVKTSCYNCQRFATLLHLDKPCNKL